MALTNAEKQARKKLFAEAESLGLDGNVSEALKIVNQLIDVGGKNLKALKLKNEFEAVLSPAEKIENELREDIDNLVKAHKAGNTELSLFYCNKIAPPKKPKTPKPGKLLHMLEYWLDRTENELERLEHYGDDKREIKGAKAVIKDLHELIAEEKLRTR